MFDNKLRANCNLYIQCLGLQHLGEIINFHDRGIKALQEKNSFAHLASSSKHHIYKLKLSDRLTLFRTYIRQKSKQKKTNKRRTETQTKCFSNLYKINLSLLRSGSALFFFCLFDKSKNNTDKSRNKPSKIDELVSREPAKNFNAYLHIG